MRPAMPTLGEPPKSSPLPGVIISALVAGLIGGGVYWWKFTPAKGTEGTPEAAAAAGAAPTAPAGDTPLAVAQGVPPTAAAGEPSAVPSAPLAVPTPTPGAALAVPQADGIKTFELQIHGALEQSIIAAVGKAVGAPLTQVVNRTLVWWVDVPQDLRKGDSLWVAYEERNGQEPLVHAVRLTSGKQGKTFEAYRYKAPHDTFARLYEPDGHELELRLVDAPLDSYEQVTSLLKDGRRHKGVDFKTPVGTPVKATFDGVITRKTWNFRGNGNSLEIKETGGKNRTALYLHLSEVPASVRVGQRVTKGQVLAPSGNTGRSFAPHLHYQLMSSAGTVLDPFESQATTRLKLRTDEQASFTAQVQKLAALTGGNTQLAAGR